jgi:protein-L-isoaspartate(D-aspartate) O-methyltransferase
MKSNNWKAYIVSNSPIPQRIQNLILRDYFDSHGQVFTLAATELNQSNSIVLKSIINDAKSDTLVFYSIDSLDLKNSEILDIVKTAMRTNSEVHFAYDNTVIKSADDLKLLDEILTINELSSNNAQGSEVEIITPLHKSTKRDYLKRVVEEDKIECSKVASQFGSEYWDGDRKFGYGGYHYDGRWKPVAESFIQQYGLTNNSKILDIGCGKGFLLLEIKKILTGIEIHGIDISEYAISNSHEEVRESLQVGCATELPFESSSFDLVLSHATLHNLALPKLEKALSEIQRVKKTNSWICIESYRNIEEKINLMYWQLTCETLMSKDSWLWLFEKTGYSGDYEFMYFE